MAVAPEHHLLSHLHPTAKLSDTEKQQLIAGLEATMGANPPGNGAAGTGGDGGGDGDTDD